MTIGITYNPAQGLIQTDGATGVTIEDNLEVSGSQVLLKGATSVGNPGTEAGGIQFSGANFDAIFKVNDIGGSLDALTVFHRHSTVDAANIVYTLSNTDTIGHAKLNSNAIISRQIFAGHSGNASIGYVPSVWIEARLDGGMASNSAPGKYDVYTTQSGSISPTLAMTIDSSQKASFKSNVDVTGSITASSAAKAKYFEPSDNAAGGANLSSNGYLAIVTGSLYFFGASGSVTLIASA